MDMVIPPIGLVIFSSSPQTPHNTNFLTLHRIYKHSYDRAHFLPANCMCAEKTPESESANPQGWDGSAFMSLQRKQFEGVDKYKETKGNNWTGIHNQRYTYVQEMGVRIGLVSTRQ